MGCVLPLNSQLLFSFEPPSLMDSFSLACTFASRFPSMPMLQSSGRKQSSARFPSLAELRDLALKPHENVCLPQIAGADKQQKH